MRSPPVQDPSSGVVVCEEAVHSNISKGAGNYNCNFIKDYVCMYTYSPNV